VQEYTLKPRLNAWVELPEARLDQRLLLQTMIEFPFRPYERIRISRVVGYDPTRPPGTRLMAGEVGYPTGTQAVPTDLVYTGTEPDALERVELKRPADEAAAVPSDTVVPTDPEKLGEQLINDLP
jgi:hypothetical protein